MRNAMMGKATRRLSILAALVLLLAVVTTGGRAQRGNSEPRDTLYDRARKAGGHLVQGFKADRSVPVANVKELAMRSDVVVVGRTLRNKAFLSKNLQRVDSEYEVSVQGVLKGDVRVGSVISVRVPGGGHRFPDGTIAALYPSNARPTRNRKTYMFFLKSPAWGEKTFDLALGIQSQFELDFTKGRVLPSDVSVMDPVVRKYTNLPIEKFLAQVREAVGRGH